MPGENTVFCGIDIFLSFGRAGCRPTPSKSPTREYAHVFAWYYSVLQLARLGNWFRIKFAAIFPARDRFADRSAVRSATCVSSRRPHRAPAAHDGNVPRSSAAHDRNRPRQSRSNRAAAAYDRKLHGAAAVRLQRTIGRTVAWRDPGRLQSAVAIQLHWAKCWLQRGHRASCDSPNVVCHTAGTV